MLANSSRQANAPPESTAGTLESQTASPALGASPVQAPAQTSTPPATTTEAATTSPLPIPDTTSQAVPDSAQKDPKESAATAPPPSKSASLLSQIQSLSSLQSRISSLRKLPLNLFVQQPQSSLLSLGDVAGLDLGLGETGPGAGAGAPGPDDPIASLLTSDVDSVTGAKPNSLGAQARSAFRGLNEVRDELLRTVTQNSLKAARESETADKSDIAAHGRRERKKRRIATVDSPAPFPSFQLQTASVFPPPREKYRRPFTLGDLPAFIRDHNKKSRRVDEDSGVDLGANLVIWVQSRPKPGGIRRVSDPCCVRVAIHDVTSVFVKLADRGGDGGHLTVESVVALGPREKKNPHSHSDFTIYQKLTQQVARMIEQEPTVSFPQLVDLLTSYEELFVTRCSICERVLSQEGHVPPVARLWIEGVVDSQSEHGRWDARHISCLHA